MRMPHCVPFDWLQNLSHNSSKSRIFKLLPQGHFFEVSVRHSSSLLLEATFGSPHLLPGKCFYFFCVINGLNPRVIGLRTDQIHLSASKASGKAVFWLL